MDSDRLLEDLNPSQRSAVTDRSGPLVVLAGAGSGKTRVITYRIAHLLARGEAQPWNILAVTFTNKAAQEMRERVYALLGTQEKDLWISTFHSACARILRGHAHLLGYERSFIIYDDRDQISLVETCMEELNVDTTRLSPRMVLSRIQAAKRDFMTPDRFLAEASSDYLDRRVAPAYELYQKRLKRAQAMDFDDLLFQTLCLLQEHEEVLGHYRRRWTHILVDEFQDTNPIQYRLVKTLAEQHRSLCVVGDDDQSIYSWRGADVENILGFERDFPDAKIIRLEQNYRSTQTILAASGAVIENNLHRKGKRLWTENDSGEPLSVYQAVDERDEAVFVVEEIRHLVSREGFRYGDVAVFYRTHAQSRVLEEELLSRGLPYSIYGGLGFYERKEIKDVVAYLRALIHPTDDVSWRRILNTPPRGIGRSTVSAVEVLAKRQGLPFQEALRQYAERSETARAPVKRIREFLKTMEDLSSKSRKLGIEELIQHVLHDSGYMKSLEREGRAKAAEREQNIQELVNLAEEFEAGDETTGLSDFLERVALVSDIDRMDQREDRISLLTLHAAKGLEFSVVFIVGMEEEIFPHTLSIEDPRGLEEERRLCYVGMTRARVKLYLCLAEARRIWGRPRRMQPSRFIYEIPDECLKALSPGGLESMPGEPDMRQSMGLYIGRWVRHRAFGVGTVTRIEENGTRVIVHFPGEGEKRFLVDQAPLEWV